MTEFNAFGVDDETVEKLKAGGFAPVLSWVRPWKSGKRFKTAEAVEFLARAGSMKVLAKEHAGWEPHYNDVQRHVTIPKGTEVEVIDEVDEPWAHRPGEGHTYWLFGWHDADGQRHETWIRTYSHVQISPLFEAPEQSSVAKPGGSD